MRGASAIEEVLKELPGQEITPLIIWEPILRTDFAPPGRNALARVSDPRAAQFWDPDHRFALDLKKKLEKDVEHPQPSCCDTESVPWDLITIYPPGAEWGSDLPRAAYADGPVYKLKASIAKAISDAKRTPPIHK